MYIKNLKELQDKVNSYNSDFLFRGQTKNYSNEKYQNSFLTSFERQPCVPSFHIKWNYYCYNILKWLSIQNFFSYEEDDDIEKYVQALLQHYGWRSNFIDLSSNIAVSSFFASFKYEDNRTIQMVEDCYENGVFDMRNTSRYIKSTEEYGVIYVFDKSLLEMNAKSSLINLQDCLCDENLRPIRQNGYLIENIDNSLNDILNASLKEVLFIETNVLIDYCMKENIDQDYLFPSNDIDIIYKELLSLPRKEFIDEQGKRTNFYKQPFFIPEYNINFNKFKDKSVAFYSTKWLIDDFMEFCDKKRKNNMEVFFRTAYKIKVYDDTPFHISPAIDLSINGLKVFDYIKERQKIIIEFNNIFKYSLNADCEYQKGIICEYISDSVKISELGVIYTGKQIQGMYAKLPYYYTFKDNKFCKIKGENECMCNDYELHIHLLKVVQVLLEGYLNGQIKGKTYGKLLELFKE